MRKLIESTLVSLDGAVEAPERWANFDAEDAALAAEQLRRCDAFVMGRVTYENFLANWGHISGDPYIDLINSMPKYVASRSLTETRWNASLLAPDPVDAITQLKGPAASTTLSCETTSSTSSTSGSGPSSPGLGADCSKTWTPPGSTYS